MIGSRVHDYFEVSIWSFRYWLLEARWVNGFRRSWGVAVAPQRNHCRKEHSTVEIESLAFLEWWKWCERKRAVYAALQGIVLREWSKRVTTVSVSPVTSYIAAIDRFLPRIWGRAKRTCCSISWRSHCRALSWDRHTRCCKESWQQGKSRGRWPIRGAVLARRVLIEPFCHSPGEKGEREDWYGGSRDDDVLGGVEDGVADSGLDAIEIVVGNDPPVHGIEDIMDANQVCVWFVGRRIGVLVDWSHWFHSGHGGHVVCLKCVVVYIVFYSNMIILTSIIPSTILILTFSGLSILIISRFLWWTKQAFDFLFNRRIDLRIHRIWLGGYLCLSVGCNHRSKRSALFGNRWNLTTHSNSSHNEHFSHLLWLNCHRPKNLIQ